MGDFLIAGLLGGIGGLTRGFVGLLKALSLRRKILWGYYAVTVVVAVVVGCFVGIIFNFDVRLSLLAGYAGTDIIEGIYKSFAVQKTYIAPSTTASSKTTKSTKK
jgi:fluoride ion exporter CrcB/FEX